MRFLIAQLASVITFYIVIGYSIFLRKCLVLEVSVNEGPGLLFRPGKISQKVSSSAVRVVLSADVVVSVIPRRSGISRVLSIQLIAPRELVSLGRTSGRTSEAIWKREADRRDFAFFFFFFFFCTATLLPWLVVAVLTRTAAKERERDRVPPPPLFSSLFTGSVVHLPTVRDSGHFWFPLCRALV